jgi:hypothetical protein
MGLPAVVAAGDRGAAKAIYGESKPYLEIGGRPLVAHVVKALEGVPEISEIWVVGDAPRLASVLATGGSEIRSKPLRILPQFRNLIENAWETYRRLLPNAPAEGRDPSSDDEEQRVLYLSADLPFACSDEISAFLKRAERVPCDYALGLCTEESMRDFLPNGSGRPGIRLATFNLREGRYRQSNLHLVKPARLRNRIYVQDMYEQRHQRRLGPVLRLAWRLLRVEHGGALTLFYFSLMHLASWADRRGWRRLSDWIRRRIAMSRIERGAGRLLGCSFRLVVTEAGGCAIDIDTEQDCDAARARFREWRDAQERRARRLYGGAPAPWAGENAS